MDIATLDSSLPSSGTFALGGGQPQLPGLQPLLVAYNSGQPIMIGGVQKQTGTAQIKLSGTADFLGVTSCATIVTFTLDAGGVPRVTVQFTLPDANAAQPWKFSTSFPNLPPSTDGKVPLSLDHLTFPSASLVLSTTTAVDATTGIAPGLNFAGTIDPAAMVAPFGALLGGTAQFAIRGTIDKPASDASIPPTPPFGLPWDAIPAPPGIMLSVPLAAPLTVGPFTLANLQLRIYSPLTTAWLAANRSYAPAMGITGHLQMLGLSVAADLSVLLFPGSDMLQIEAALSGVSLGSLADLAQVANGSDLFSALPSQVQQLGSTIGGMTLDRVSITFDGALTTSAITDVVMRIGLPSTATWDVFQGFGVKLSAIDLAVISPFTSERSVSVCVVGSLDVSGATVEVFTTYPNFDVRGELRGTATLPLRSLFSTHFPELPPPPDVAVSGMEVYFQPGQTMSFRALMFDASAGGPPWTLDLGPTTLTLSNVALSLSKTAGAFATGAFSAFLQLGSMPLQVNYQLPGSFQLNADLPSVKLSDLTSCLDQIGLSLPAGFDLAMPASYVSIDRDPTGGLTLYLASVIASLGPVVFAAQKTDRWGFAVGVDLSTSSISSIPTIGPALSAFLGFCDLSNPVMVVSSLDVRGFQFPGMSHFNVPSLGTKNIALPPQASGVVRGVNVYAQLGASRNRGLGALLKYLSVPTDLSIGMTLSVSLPNPQASSKLLATITRPPGAADALAGTLQIGVVMQNGSPAAYLGGRVNVTIQNNPVIFDVAALVVPNGVFISGTMITSAPPPARGTVQIGAVQIKDLALVVGLDFEGLPSFGIAGTIDVNNFQSSVAIFLNSANPMQSMVAGALDHLTLLDVACVLAGQQSVPGALSGPLNQIGLKPLLSTTLPLAAAALFDARDIAGISTALAQRGVTVPAVSDQLHLIVNAPGSVWHMTDMRTMEHYRIERQPNQLAVLLQPQFYFAPQATTIGALPPFPQGMHVDAEIDSFALKARVRVSVVNSGAQPGISADVDVAPIVLIADDVFSVKGATGTGGPRLSLATFTQPAQTDPLRRPPHVLVSGSLNVLGLAAASTNLTVTTGGLSFAVSSTSGSASVSLSGSVANLTNMQALGSVQAGFNGGNLLSLGTLGHVAASVRGTLTVAIVGANATATVAASVSVASVTLTIPSFSLPIHGGPLASLSSSVAGPAASVVSSYLGPYSRWLDWVERGIIQGIVPGSGVVSVLAHHFNLSPTDIFRALLPYGIGSSVVAAVQSTFNLDSTGMLRAMLDAGLSMSAGASLIRAVYQLDASAMATLLKAFGSPADTVSTILNGLGYAANEIENALSSAFDWVKEKLNPSNW